jgi:murein DD-endopeptidase MepM/ murein hydrolase activator NlpD
MNALKIVAVTFSLFVVTHITDAEADTPPSFSKPGELATGSGTGLKDDTVYYPDMRFPTEKAPAYLNSQVYRPGGQHGGGGGQCASANYSYPWVDNFCETRSWANKLCPAGKGHQGVDIRPATCQRDVHWAVAVDDGVIANVGKFSVTLQTAAGTLYRYLHMSMNDLAVNELDHVKKGQKIGKVSNDFDGTPTTIHLHFDIKDRVVIDGKEVATYIPPYASLTAAYERLINQSGN